MAGKRSDQQESIEDTTRIKRQKVASSTDMNPRENPYLAHRFEEPQHNGVSDNWGSKNGFSSSASTLSSFKRHRTTAKAAKAAEDGPKNPFNGKALSEQYFSILKTRRGLPVHVQR